MPEYVEQPGSGTSIQERDTVEIPRRFRVLLLNDHYTTMDFVVYVLEQVFHKAPQEAQKIMLNVHKNGMGVAGVYVKAVAETKIMATHTLARKNGFPLRCSMEPE
ncbi:MAG TPA: ATP-dependent Clp protease adaptor ClpS [Candidatus Hydrogenedentes bacterium]|nr:ATP-dependent Clp protease adaptor ClpS [Candidatus Hydrogenedentota bacterium]